MRRAHARKGAAHNSKKSPVDNRFVADRIAAIVAFFGDTQQQFAERIGPPGSQAEVSKWLKGGEPPMRALQDIAALVGADLSIFQENREPDQFSAGVRYAMRSAYKGLGLSDSTELQPFLGEGDQP